MKKIWMCCLAVCLLLLSLGAGCRAESAVGMPIQTADDFLVFMQTAAENPQTNAYLVNDIDLEGKAVFQSVPCFSGVLEGNGYALKNLRMENDGGESALFLEIAAEGCVQNLHLTGLFSGARAAALAVVSRGSIINVKNSAEIYLTDTGAGLVCDNYGRVEECINSGSIYVLNGGKGAGLVGINYGVISGCTNHSIINGTIMTPYARYTCGICAETYDESVIENCINLGRISAGERGAGIVGYANDALLCGLINFGDVYGIVDDIGGIVSLIEGGLIENCTNYGDIICNVKHSAGIAAEGGAEITNCSNYGTVSAETYAAGIATYWHGDIVGCRNYGDISAYNYTAGICNQLYGTVADCSNAGEIVSQSQYTAGIVSELNAGKVERCSNSGHIYGGANGWADSLGNGGIVGMVVGQSYISDVCNTGLVEARYVTEFAGLVGHLEGTLTNALNFSDTPVDVYSTKDASITNVYSRYADGKLRMDMESFYTGELAWQLNTSGGAGNSGVWSQGDDHPVLADAYHQPTCKYLCLSRMGESIVYSGSDGKVDAPLGAVARSATYTDENGAEVAYDEIVRESNLFSRKKETAYVSDIWALQEALVSTQVDEIVLLNNVTLTSSITLRKDKILRGQGYRLYLGEFNVVCDADLVVSDLSVISESGTFEIKSGKLRVEGFLEVNAPVQLSRGTLDLSDGIICNKNEVDGVACIQTKNNAVFEGYTAVDGAYYSFIPAKSMTAKELVAPAEFNSSLAYDVYPEIRNGIVYFFMPCTAKLNKVTICSVDENGEYLQTYKNLNLADGNAVQVSLYGSQYPVQALQSGLPTLIFDIDESVVTIDEMNSSEDHSVHCFGDVRLEVTAQLQKEKKWSGFVSKENDAEKAGTVAIRGRGNSTWSTQLDVKKPYQFKLEKKVDVLGMGKHKTWILLRNDARLVENKLGFDLAADLGLAYTSMGEFVDLFMNGRYLGTYLLCERVEISKERVNITKLDQEYEDNGNSTKGLDLSGGYLLEFDRAGEELQIKHPSGNIITVKEPEDLALSVTEDGPYSYIREYMLDFMDAIFSEDGLMSDGSSYLEHIDIDSFARYFFHQEFLMNADCGRGSTFMYKDRDSVDPLLYAGPVWDHDRILECGWSDCSGWFLNTVTRDASENLTVFNQLSRRSDFAEVLVEYYENSDIAQILGNASSYIPGYIEMLEDSAQMNSLRWWLPEFDINWMITTLDRRAAWIAENIRTLLDGTN